MASKTATKNSWTFKVDGPLWGYRQGRAEAFRPERRAFKNRVRLIANLQGIPDVLPPRPVHARIIVEIYWKNRARIDGKNILGILEDSLWSQDRLIRFGSYETYENSGEEYVQVFVKIIQGDKT